MSVVSAVQEVCLLKTVRRWPYLKTPKTSQAVLKRFFDKDPFFNRIWDLYILESPPGMGNASGIVVPSEQVKTFFKQIETETAISLKINDQDLLLNIGASADHVLRLIGVSTSWEDYQMLSQCPLARACVDPCGTASAPRKGHGQNKGTKSEKKRQTQLESRRKMLNSAIEVFNEGQSYVFFAIDIESWEKNHNIVTEIGLTRYLPGGKDVTGRPCGKTFSEHIIIKEHRRYKNGDYVVDASGNFEFGDSKQVPLQEIKSTLTALMSTPENHQRILIGHDINADIEYLRKLGYEDELKNFVMTFDTVEIWKAVAGTFDGISLGRLCSELNIPAWNLHNAGNDARYTMDVFVDMVSKAKTVDVEVSLIQ